MLLRKLALAALLALMPLSALADSKTSQFQPGGSLATGDYVGILRGCTGAYPNLQNCENYLATYTPVAGGSGTVTSFSATCGTGLNCSVATPASVPALALNLGLIPYGNGGTGLSSLGAAGQCIQVNSGATALQYGPCGVSYTAGSGIAINGSALSVVYGTSAATAAAGNDTRITGALQGANNLSDLGNAATARTNLGLGSAAVASLTALLQPANNLADLANLATARSNLGLLALATQNTVALGTQTTGTLPLSSITGTGALASQATVALGSQVTGILPAANVAILNQNTTGTAATATALAATPTGCSAGQFATGIAANGTAACATPVGAITQLSGDGTTPPNSSGAAVFTLGAVNATTGTFGSASSVPVITTNAKGLTTSATSTPISITLAQVSNAGTAAAQPIGTSGIALGLLSTANTHSALQTFNLSGLANPTAPSGAVGVFVGSSSPSARLATIGLGTPAADTVIRLDAGALTAGEQIGSFNVGGSTSPSAYVTGVAAIVPFAGENWSTTANGTGWRFDTTPLGTTALQTSSVVIAPSGLLTANYGATVAGLFNAGTGTFTGPVTAPGFIGNLTGTASNVTTNANLTGPVTSVGNATAIGTGAISNANLAFSSITLGTSPAALGSTVTSLGGLTSVSATSLFGALTGNVTGNVSGSAGTVTTIGTGQVANSNLANSTITIGTSPVSLGSSLTNLLGLNSVAATSFIGSLTGSVSGTAPNVTGIVAVANGGTGGTTAATGRSGLGAAASGSNGDITALTALTSSINSGLSKIASLQLTSLTTPGLLTTSATGAVSSAPVGTAAYGNYPRVSANGVNYATPAPLKAVCFNHLFNTTATSAPGTDSSSTSRTPCTLPDPVSRLSLLLWNGNGNSGSTDELNGYNPVIMRASLESPAGVTIAQLALNGQTTFVVDPAAADVNLDVVGTFLPANTAFYIRNYIRVAVPPTAPSATAVAVTGGVLAASTTYYYKVTAIDTGIESGPTAEFTCATGSSTLACNLSWTANVNASGYKIYRSTTSGAEVLVATIGGTGIGNGAAPITGWQDLGSGQAVSTATPPAGQKHYFDHTTVAGIKTNVQQDYNGGFGSGADLTGTAATTGFLAEQFGGFAATPFVVMADDYASNNYCLDGDSISNGVGIFTNGLANIATERNSWWAQANYGTTRSATNVSIPGAKLTDMTGSTSSFQSKRRLDILNTCDYTFLALLRNDLYAAGGTPTWQSLAVNRLAEARYFAQHGKRAISVTLLPNTFAARGNYFIDVASQTYQQPSDQNGGATNYTALEPVRQNFNTWVRNGSQVDGSGNPVLTGGTPSPYIFSFFDAAAPVEVNSAGVLTLNGGYWLPGAKVYSGQAIASSTTPTATSIISSTTTYPLGLASYMIKMTSGAAAGQMAMITNNNGTNNATLTLGANGTGNSTGLYSYIGLTTTPAAGDTFDIYAINTFDGVHGTKTSYAAIGSAANTFIAALPTY